MFKVIPHLSIFTLMLFLCIKTSIAGTIECQKSANIGKCLAVDGNTSVYKIGSDSTIVFNEPTNRTTLWVSSVIDSVFNLISPNGSIPHDSISYINNTNPLLDININTSSTRDGYDSGNTSLITSLVGDLNLISDGKDGTKGQSSSELCAKSFSSGSLGVEAKKYWDSRGDGLDPKKCVKADIEFADSMFKCPSDGYVLSNNIPIDSVDLSRVISKRRCSARVNQQICIGRTADLKCNINTISNVCCSDTNKKWENLGSFYNQPPQGSSCVDLKCSNTSPDKTKDTSNRSGDISEFVFRIFEKEYLLAGSTDNACVQRLKHSPMKISWSVPFFNTETGRDDYHPGNSKIIERKEEGAQFYQIPNNNFFTIPKIDNIESVNGDSLVDADLRYYIEEIDQSENGVINNATEKFPNAICYPGLTSSDPKAPPCGKRIKNCLGLNGTNTGKLTCERTPGPPFWIKIGLIDKYGAKSNALRLQIPEGRFGWSYTMAWTNNSRCDNSYECRNGVLIGGFIPIASIHSCFRGTPGNSGPSWAEMGQPFKVIATAPFDSPGSQCAVLPPPGPSTFTFYSGNWSPTGGWHDASPGNNSPSVRSSGRDAGSFPYPGYFTKTYTDLTTRFSKTDDPTRSIQLPIGLDPTWLPGEYMMAGPINKYYY